MELVYITRAEKDLMDILWKKSPRTLGEIQQEVSLRCSWTENVVMILLSRLKKKEAVQQEDMLGTTVFTSLVSPDETHVGSRRGLWSRLTDQEAILLVNTKGNGKDGDHGSEVTGKNRHRL